MDKSRRGAAFISKLYEGNRSRCAATVALLCTETLLSVFIAYLLQRLLDVANSGTFDELIRLVAFSGIYWAALLGVSLALRKARNDFIERGMRQYKDYAFERISRKNVGAFAREKTGDYISMLTNDAASVENNYMQGTLNLATQALYFVGALAMMLYYSWSLTLVVAALSAIPVIASLSFGDRLARSEERVSAKNGVFVGTAKDLLSGFAVIKSFKAELEAAKLFEGENGELERTKCRRRKLGALIDIIMGTTGGVLQIGVFVYGAYLAISGRITAGVVVAFVQLMNYILSPVRSIPSLVANRKAALALVDKLAEVCEQSAGRAGDVSINGIGDGIALEGVSFAYPDAENTLDGITLRFEAGKSYAIVGASGSGKTTLLNLLLGGLEGYEGRVTIGGAELREIAPDSLYDLLSIIQQNVFVFDSTIANNICMFKDFPPEAVEAAIRRAGLSALVETHGPDYRCGENGAQLSGGEKQRISIARCLLRDTPVLLMDEATAALDANTAREVTDAILSVENLTRIVVTHKLDGAQMRRYDEIIALRDGRVVESGDFDALMAQKGYFFSLFTVSGT